MLLDGSSLADYIKERQAKTVRSLHHAKIIPKLAIVQAGDSLASDTYIKMKKRYGTDIGIDVEVYKASKSSIQAVIKKLNEDLDVHGIIVQLPLPDDFDTNAILNQIAPNKDVDGLGEGAVHDAATPTAILWLLAGYNVELKNKKIVLIGQGRLVGKPLVSLLVKSDLNPILCDDQTKDLETIIKDADVIISATGQPGLIKSNQIPASAVVIDAGTADVEGELKGDVEADARDRKDIKITPVKGGLGPLTVAALFENVITTAREAT